MHIFFVNDNILQRLEREEENIKKWSIFGFARCFNHQMVEAIVLCPLLPMPLNSRDELLSLEIQVEC